MNDTKAIDQAKQITDDAVGALWSVFKRPKPDGGQWGDIAGCASKADYRKSLGERAGKLREVCRMAISTPGITDGEMRALKAYLEIDQATELAHRQSGPRST